ncbi:Ig-like domain-containing protein [Algoriphagus halophilus]|uniref:Ig-like domain-containing protein n=1 Tax=Algoriphagus halophilus TaxID=226505 RepID=A0A1N6HP20_9BACT|nr:T9SS type A sorting domain-containing protein [Algoriphagus halophilus]SIO21439.1 hypothetical protein SAMN05444394_3857 [Algoriphagus halophilus]
MRLKHFLPKILFQPIFLLGMMLGMVFSNFLAAQTQTITTPGSGTFTVPPGVKVLKVEAWGAGGSGGNDRGGGGGGGSYSRSNISSPFLSSYPYVVGAGASNSNGGLSSFGSGPILVSAGGGTKGTDNGNGGAGGIATVGNESQLVGSAGNIKSGSSGGNGGNAAGNGGTGGAGGANTIAGTIGSNPGGGGGGSGQSNTTRPRGGNGQIRISYIALTSATGTDNQTVCEGSPITGIIYSVPTGSTATVTNLPSGITPFFTSGSGILTFSGTPTSSGTYNINITTGYGVTLSTTGTINITAETTIDTHPIGATYCKDDTPVDLTVLATGTGTITYEWFSNTSNSTIGGTSVGTGNTYTPPTDVDGSRFYYAVASSSVCGQATSDVVEIIVTPETTIDSQPVGATYCQDDTPVDLTVSATGTGTFTYEWFSNTSNSTIGGTSVGTGNTYSPPTDVDGSMFYYAVASSSVCGQATSDVVEIIVTPETTIDSQPVGATYCQDDIPVDLTVSATGTGTFTYEWFSNTSNSTIGGTSVGTGNTYSPPTDVDGSMFYYAVASSSVCGQATSDVVEIIVTPETVIDTHPSSIDQTQCIGVGFNQLQVLASGTGTLTYQWYSNTTNSISGPEVTPVGTDSPNFTPPSTTVGTLYYFVEITSDCSTLTSDVSGAITVNPATSIDSENLSAQSACIGQTSFSPISISASGTGTLNYQWYSTSTPTNSGGTPVGSNSSSYTPDASTLGTLYYYVEVSSDCGPTVTSNISGAFIVDPITAITTQPDNSDRVECFGDGFNPLSVVAEGGDLTYQWYSVPTQTNSGGTAVVGATSATFTPPSSTEGISYYYVVVTGNCGIETSSVSGEFRVNPPKTVIDINPSTSDETECLGDPFPTLSVLASGEGTVTYQWYKNTTPSNTGGTLIPSAISEDYTPPSDEVGTYYYYAVASSNCGTIPTDVSGAFTVTPLTEIENESLAGQTICDVETFNPISVNAIGTGTIHYQWYSNSTASTTGPDVTMVGTDSNTFTPPTTAQGTTTFYFVEVSSDCGPNVISSTSGAFTVSIDNTASTPSSDPTLCINTPLADITIATTGATGISNDGDNTGINGLPAGVSASWSGDIITISGSPSESGTFNYAIPLIGGCGIVEATGTITVTPDNTANIPSSEPTLCIDTPLTDITIATTGATGISNDGDDTGVNGLPVGVSASWSGDIITITGTPTESGTFNYSIPLTGGCGIVNATGSIFVTPDNTAGAPSSDPTLCINSALTDITIATTGATGISNDGDDTGVNGLPAGVLATWSGDVITISGTPSESGTFNYSIPLTGGCGTTLATGTITVTPLATVGPTSVAYPSVCISSPILTPFTQSTNGVTGIGTPVGLPDGINASFDINTGLITFSGTATSPTIGAQTYSIPLIGDCINGLEATGTIEVSPDYTLTAVTSVSATTIGGSATITMYGDPTILSNGTYEVVYEIAEGAGSFTQVGPVNVSVNNGKGSFLTNAINDNTETYTVKILSLKKTTDQCTVTLPDPPTTYFGICAAVYSTSSTFYVPANVYSITIEVYGGGGGGGKGNAAVGGGGGAYSIRTNIPVTPGEPLGVIVGAGGSENTNGGMSYVTRDSNISDQQGNSLVYAGGGNSGLSTSFAKGESGNYDTRHSGEDGTNSVGNKGGDGGGPLGGIGGSGGTSGTAGKSPGGGGGSSNGTGFKGGNGLVVISYSCPDADDTDCITVIDDGSKSGNTVIEYTCDGTWTAPEGLSEFTVYVGSGGGGGGSGEGSGGGGSGAMIVQTFSTTNPYGLPVGTTFGLEVGQGGPGAGVGERPGTNGEASEFTGEIDGNSIDIFVSGGGGGGSQIVNAGGNGSSGGGGGATPAPNKSFGSGGNAIPLTYSGTPDVIYNGNAGGNGDYNDPQNAIAGGGGGGLIPWKPAPAEDGQHGKAAGAGQGEGGRGGDAVTLSLGDTIRYYGAGGGGIGEYFNGTEKIGEGGKSLVDETKLGGDGNLDILNTNGIGYSGVDKTGSGGGAGYNGGGKGGDGIIYIVFKNFKILQVEYLYFETKFDEVNRNGQLSWATSKEWANAKFEVERSIGDANNWEKIGEVAGQGYKDSQTDYTFTDTQLPGYGGNIFYRLKQVDFEDTFTYSVTRAIQVPSLKGESNWIIYPNPSELRSNVTVGLINPSNYHDEPIIVRISDVRGINVSYSANSVEEVNRAVNSYLETAISGMHIVQLIWGDQSEQLKLIRK